MTRQEFIQELELALQGQLSQAAVNDNIRYYDNYIKEEVRKGNTEQAVIERLGNPRLIAKTLIDTTDQYHRAAGREYHGENYGKNQQGKGFYAGYSQEDGWNVKMGGRKLNSWLGKFFLIVAAILIVVVAANVVAFLMPIVVPGVLILLIFYIFFVNRR